MICFGLFFTFIVFWFLAWYFSRLSTLTALQHPIRSSIFMLGTLMCGSISMIAFFIIVVRVMLRLGLVPGY